ncbi:iron-containing alcohol dehydrogenase family protein [Metabacillus malikii]|uniref:Glycerol-1-phosphate dehydrogenase [NAD(P)+] n=1 Tax=Metabacillus malikii TaxID=1504265 RepID=A0ABT9ZGD8_9BACI|nr:iron-containing alcohol dehydrogenase family protein [Metabacillus malikii]MDQ0230315.1 glycerol-1-phosphate dehydrogenase [NAD(P)+] [Metabacillus malikii]
MLPITNIQIPTILEINNGALFNLEKILIQHGFNKALLLFDEFTYENFRVGVLRSIQSVTVTDVLMPNNIEIQELIKKAFEFEQYEVVMTIGGGMVIDYGKYIAFVRNIPFLSIPTSASNDGFASSNCSLIVNHKKTTVPARVPFGIVVDLDIVQQAPNRFILAGIGDLMSNITALVDWEFEEEKQGISMNHFAYMLSKKAVNSFIRTPMTDIKAPIFLKELVSSLTLGGISTVISGNSSPISGSEHLISHMLDKISQQPQMHGIQVGVATYIMANVQNHRAERVTKVFSRTGFFDYVKQLDMKKTEYRYAIENAHMIKPNRYTYLHDAVYRQKAIRFLEEDEMMNEIFKE